jgi:hypothetical protein
MQYETVNNRIKVFHVFLLFDFNADRRNGAG